MEVGSKGSVCEIGDASLCNVGEQNSTKGIIWWKNRQFNNFKLIR